METITISPGFAQAFACSRAKVIDKPAWSARLTVGILVLFSICAALRPKATFDPPTNNILRDVVWFTSLYLSSIVEI